MNHVMLGAAPVLVLLTVWYARRGWRASLRMLIIGPAAMVLSGAWAIVPDMPRALGALETYNAWHHARWCNLHWFHCAIDADEVDWAWYPLAFGAMGGLVLFVAWRELRLREREGRS